MAVKSWTVNTRNTEAAMRKSYKILFGKRKGKIHFGDLQANWRLILKLNLK